MALATLVPWPSDTAEVTAAVEWIRELLSVNPLRLPDERVSQIAKLVADRIQKAAPDAPDEAS